MASYKITKGQVGPWAEGQTITDQDLKEHPEFGGVKRLRDELGVIQDTPDAPGVRTARGDATLTEHVGDPGRAAANTTGRSAVTGPSTAAGATPPPNAGRPAGKS